MSSYYAATRAYSSDHAAAAGDLACDVCIVGGGYTGLSAALFLAENGRDVILLEAEDIGHGASGRNGGQIGSAHVILQPGLEQTYGPQKARALWDISERAKALAKSLIDRHEIDCDYRPGNMGCASTRSDMERLERHVETVRNRYGYGAYEVLDRAQAAQRIGTDIYCGAVNDPTAGHLHPLNYALGLAAAARKAGVRLFCRSAARILEAGPSPLVTTDGARIRADHVILACNGYLHAQAPDLAPDLVRRHMAVDNYQLATAPLAPVIFNSILVDNGCYWDTSNQVYYYRKTRDLRLIFGGGLTVPDDAPGDAKAFVRRHMLKVFPRLKDAEIEFAWGGTLAATRSGLPDFGQRGANVHYSQGYNGHGVALATLCGQLLGENIIGASSGYDLLSALAPGSYPLPHILRGPILKAAFVYYAIADALQRPR